MIIIIGNDCPLSNPADSEAMRNHPSTVSSITNYTK